jgi:molecular chaperone GrpE (heat shock protein)
MAAAARPAEGAAASPPTPVAEAAGPEIARPEKAERPRRPARPPLEGVDEAVSSGLEQLLRAVDAVARIEAAVQPFVGMLQGIAKWGVKSDRDRQQQFLELRAHITGETDRLAETLRAQITREASVEVWRALVLAIDDIDHVLREAPTVGETRGIESLRLVRRKLRDALSRLEIEEISVEARITQFDPELHEGQPHDGDGDDAAGLAAGTIVRLERTGYVAGERVLRCALVTVVNGQQEGS